MKNSPIKLLMCLKKKNISKSQVALIAQLAWGGVAYSHNKAVRASFFVSWKIAQEKAPHTAGENLIKPAAVEMATILCGDAVANKLAMVPLTNNTIKRRIQKLSEVFCNKLLLL